MPVSIRENERYQSIAKSLMRKNVSGEKNVKGIFSTLAKWRQPIPEEDKIALNRIFAKNSKMREEREKIKQVWTKILKTMPMPRYPN